MNAAREAAEDVTVHRIDPIARRLWDSADGSETQALGDDVQLALAKDAVYRRPRRRG